MATDVQTGTPAGSDDVALSPGGSWRGRRGWQVRAVERREHLLEDQSELDRAKAGRRDGDPGLRLPPRWLKHPVSRHVALVPGNPVQFAKRWGMRVALDDLHRVIAAASGSSSGDTRSAGPSSPPLPPGTSEVSRAAHRLGYRTP